MMRVGERASGMECEECQHLWKAYQRATIESIQECQHVWKAYQRATIESIRLGGKVRSMDEYQSLRQLIETTARAEAAVQLRVEARQELAEHLAATGHL
jgi:DNA polymerase/3'-5' exonuclease PolX